MKKTKKWIAALTCIALLVTSIIGSSALVFAEEETVVAKDAELPEIETIYWGQEPVEVISSEREEMVLNGIWNFMPGSGSALDKPAEKGWGYIRVPGMWTGSVNLPMEQKIVATGEGDMWPETLKDLTQGWYRRDLTIPESWAGKKIVLDFERVSTDAVIYIDGKECGKIQWPGGNVDITDYITPGKKSELLVMVAVFNTMEEYIERQSDWTVVRYSSVQQRGILDDVVAKAYPQGATVSGVFVKTSVRENKIDLEVDIKDVTKTQDAIITAVVKDMEGNEVKRFSQTVLLNEAEEQTVTLTSEWADPHLWEVDDPFLYNMYVQVKGQTINDEFAQRFGFREFWIEGRDFYLNGTKFHLKPTMLQMEGLYYGIPSMIDANVEAYVKSNFNIIEIWPDDEYSRGNAIDHSDIAEACDRYGLAMIYPVVSPDSHILPADKRNNAEAWEEVMVEKWKEIRNHPSIFMLTGWGNQYSGNDDLNPLRIGQSENLNFWNNINWRAKKPVGEKYVATVKSYDDTRPVFAHHGGNTGDMHASNMYLNLHPLQEREEWISEWAEKGDMPFSAIEFGSPVDLDFLRVRDGATALSSNSDALATEYATVYFGEEAYVKELTTEAGQAYRKQQGESYYDGSFHHLDTIMTNPIIEDYSKLFITNTWRSWRTYGISGGMIPWTKGHGWDTVPDHVTKTPTSFPEFKPGDRGVFTRLARNDAQVPEYSEEYRNEVGDTIVAANAPTMAYIGGKEEEFVTKDHHYYSNGAVEKSVILINDERKPVKYSVSWSADLAGTAVADGTYEGEIAVGDVVFLPINFTAPAVADKTDGTIKMTAKMGDATHEDDLAYRVYPTYSNVDSIQRKVMICDPEGETKALVEKLGYNTVEWDGSVPNTTATEETAQKLNGKVVLGVDSAISYLGSTKTYVDPENLSVKPIIEADRTLVPIRYISEAFGAQVDWDEATETVSIKLDDKAIRIVIGEKTIYVNEQPIEIDVAATVKNDRTLVPLRAVSEALAKKVYWDPRGLIVIDGNADAPAELETAFADEMVALIDTPILVIGRHALENGTEITSKLGEFVKNGGHAVVFGQDPDWIRMNAGYRVSRYVSRNMWPVTTQKTHAITNGIDAEDLRDWNGAGTLIEKTDYDSVAERNGQENPRYGWHWGNNGSVSSAALEKTHNSAMTPILNGEYDMMYSPLMEMDYGKGHLIWCTLDVEGRTKEEPVANIMTKNILSYSKDIAPAENAAKTAFIGSEDDEKLLATLGVIYEKVDAVPEEAGLLLIGEDAKVEDAAVLEFMEKGGKVFFLGYNASSGLFAKDAKKYAGTLDVPDWDETKGIAMSDLRLRIDVDAMALTSGGEIAADGLLGKITAGDGVAIAIQLTSANLDEENFPQLRSSKWRLNHAVSQIITNLGGSFTTDDTHFAFDNALYADNFLNIYGNWKYKEEQLVPTAPSPNDLSPEPEDIGSPQGWHLPDFDDSDWVVTLDDPEWDNLADIDGVFWFRREFEIPESLIGMDLTVELGAVDDYEVTYFNGVEIGRTVEGTPDWWGLNRVYTVPKELVKPGRNVISMRLYDNYGGGGMYGSQNQMKIGYYGAERFDFYTPGFDDSGKFSDDPYVFFRW